MIGYYVHHHGNGHVHRAAAIVGHLRQPVTVISSLPRPDWFPPCAGWERLSRDDTGDDFRDTNARGLLHWAPLDHPGLRARMVHVASWIEHHRPALIHVDVSVEIALLARLLGVPTSTLAMPGRRPDNPHQAGYRIAEALLAAWPDTVELPPHLAPHAARVRTCGGISRFEGRPRVRRQRRNGESSSLRVVVMAGAGGTDWTEARVREAAAATPGVEWEIVGLGNRWVPDPWIHLQRADVVVAAAGQGSVADLAAARVPAVIVPQDRPFAEQKATAEAVRRAGLAVVVDGWPPTAMWPELLRRAVVLGGDGWVRWQVEGAAGRAAAVLDHLAAGYRLADLRWADCRR